jgi:hypothetical protein
LSIFVADLQNHTSTTFSWIPINICRDPKLPLSFGSGAKPGPTNNIFSDFALLKKIIPDSKTSKSGVC